MLDSSTGIGLFNGGGGSQLGKQAIGVAAYGAWAVVTSLVVLYVLLRNDFMDEDDVEDLLRERVGKKTANNIIEGIFTPLSTSEGALEGRFKNMERGNPDDFLDEDEFLPLDDLDDADDVDDYDDDDDDDDHDHYQDDDGR